MRNNKGYAMELSFGERLLLERQRLGLTQVEFAKLGGVSRLAQLKYEHGEHMPSVDYLERLFRAKVDAVFLLTGRKLTSNQMDWDIARDAYVFVHRNFISKPGKDYSPEKLFELFSKYWQAMMEDTYGSSVTEEQATSTLRVSEHE